MNISFSETFKKVTSVTTIAFIVFSMMSPVAFAGPITGLSVSSQTGILTTGTAGSATYTITLNKAGGNSITNTLTVTSALPAGVTATFGTNPITWSTNGTTTSLTLTTTMASPAGVTTFTVEGASGITNTGTLTIGGVSDTTPPTISNITSTTIDGTYGVGTVIPLNVTFSEAVTSTGNVTLTTDTGRTCTFTVTSSTTGSCNYTVQAGDNSSDLNISTVSGTITDGASLTMVNFTPTTNLAANKAIIIDTTAPSVPTNTLPNGTSVNTDGWDFTWNASTDNQPGAITYEYQASQNPTVDGFGVLTTGVWSSGSLSTNMIHSAGAAEGVWYWQVRAKDVLGNYSAWSPVARVTKDTIAPVISTDDSFLTVGAVTATGAIITYTTVPTATDVGTPSPTVTCSPSSGTNFALNSIATITCNSTDTAGNTGVQTFNITIEDEEDPVLLVPGDISVEVVAPSSASVTFTASATDNVDPTPAIVCSHLSGSTFNFGTTIVTCTATDSEGNDTTDDFNVIVEDTTAPTLAVTMDDTNLNVGDTALVTFTFSEAPVGFDNTDITVENGTLDTLAGSGTVYTATFTPTAGIEDLTNKITVGTDWSDANTPTGNAPTGLTESTNYQIDTLIPVISNVTTEVLYPAGLSIRWKTNEPTTSQLQYGLTTAYGSTSPLDTALVTEHIVDIHGLDSPAEYYFEIMTTDSFGNTANTTTGGSGSASTSEGGSGGITSTGGGLFQTPIAPTPTNPTQPTTPENTNTETPTNSQPAPTPEPTPTTPEVTPTPENPETPVDNNNTPTPTPNPTPAPATIGGTAGGNTAPAFNPADATLDVGGAGNPEPETATEEVAPVEGVNDAGGGVVPEEDSYTLLWTLLGLIALLNTWWFFVAKNKPQTHRRD